ncbi:FG-GAP-like repeat-containing protein [Streptacidiphilus sp. PAMC 29251]
MKRRSLGKLAAVTALALAGALAPAVQAQAATGFYRCPKGYFCAWDHTNAQGAMYKTKASAPTLGSWNNRMRSYSNRTTSNVCIYADPNYGSSGTVWDELPNQSGSGNGYNLSMDRKVSSLKLVRTDRECLGTAYADWTSAAHQPKASGFGDLNNDGYADLLSRDEAGRLWSTSGVNGRGRDIGPGWGAMTAITRHGDVTGDGKEDVIARDARGRLWVYPGDGKGGVTAHRLLGQGWNSMTRIAAVGDFNGDGHGDLLAVSSNGGLYLYLGTGHGTIGSHKRIGEGWKGITALVGVGDINGDGHADFLFRTAKGTLMAAYGNGKGGIRSSANRGKGWNDVVNFVANGDATGDGRNDFVTLANIPDGSGTDMGIGRVSAGTGKGTFAAPQAVSPGWWELNGIY